MPDALGIEFGNPTLVKRARKPETGFKAVRSVPKHMDSELSPLHLPPLSQAEEHRWLIHQHSLECLFQSGTKPSS